MTARMKMRLLALAMLAGSLAGVAHGRHSVTTREAYPDMASFLFPLLSVMAKSRRGH